MGQAIIVRDVSKIFKITPFRNDSLRQNLQRAIKFAFHKNVLFPALTDINFEVAEGEVFGIIGMNGSGKSTLLKILSKIMVPTRGRVELFGKINTLLEVGTGFHPELTGRENIFLNGSILGLSRQEIKSKFDAIVDFSEVESFLDTPVKHYSSGMFVRLAFAVAANLDPDILIVDEVLSVGDAAFQKKCIQKMEEEVLQGRTVLFVSHNMDQVRRLCNRVMLLHQGRIKHIGKPVETIGKYLTEFQEPADNNWHKPEERRGTGTVRMVQFLILDENRQPSEVLVSGSGYIFRLFYQSQYERLSYVDFVLKWKSLDDVILFSLHSKFNFPLADPINGTGYLDCIIDRFPLNAGRYLVDVTIDQEYELADVVNDAFVVDVVKGSYYPTGDLPDPSLSVLIDARWSLPESK
ncbi:MAG: ABC transporter ATP-binding protein [Saprospiraceae bacterium]|nr:ABC transporter ATP-binding protein [Saprospiraceae bacterium]